MAPMVHGLEAEYSGRIAFVYLDADDPRTREIQRASDSGTNQNSIFSMEMALYCASGWDRLVKSSLKQSSPFTCQSRRPVLMIPS